MYAHIVFTHSGQIWHSNPIREGKVYRNRPHHFKGAAADGQNFPSLLRAHSVWCTASYFGTVIQRWKCEMWRFVVVDHILIQRGVPFALGVRGSLFTGSV